MNVRFDIVPALALALGFATAVSADTRQLAASAGLDAAEAAGYGAAEIVALKINAEARRDDRYAVVIPVASTDPAARAQLAAAAGASPAEADAMSLTELAMAKIDREARGQDRVRTVETAPIDGGAGRAQIIASIGLDPEIGRAMTLHEIHLAKFVRESADD